MKEKSFAKPAAIEKHVAGFDIEKIEITLVGSVEEAKLWVEMTARGSSTKLRLVGDPRTKTDTLDAVRKLIADGKKLLKVSGTLKEIEVDIEGKKEKKLVVEIASAEAVEEKKKP